MLLAARRPQGADPQSTTGPLGTCDMSQRAQRIIEAARKVPLPEGTYAVGVGLLISGLTAYAFQILAFKALPKTEYAAAKVRAGDALEIVRMVGGGAR